MAEPTGLRARKKLETRRRIETAGLGLFSDEGFEATTVEAIAAAADISPRTFFHYFPTKEDVVLADYADRLARIVDQLRQQPPELPPWSALKASFLVVASDYDAERDLLVRRFRVMLAAPSVYARSLLLQSGWEDEVAIALAGRMGCQPDNLGPRLLASAALSALRSAQRHWLATGEHDALPALVEECFDDLATGLDHFG